MGISRRRRRPAALQAVCERYFGRLECTISVCGLVVCGKRSSVGTPKVGVKERRPAGRQAIARLWAPIDSAKSNSLPKNAPRVAEAHVALHLQSAAHGKSWTVKPKPSDLATSTIQNLDSRSSTAGMADPNISNILAALGKHPNFSKALLSLLTKLHTQLPSAQAELLHKCHHNRCPARHILRNTAQALRVAPQTILFRNP
jgi:hypothetical protein